MLYGEILFGLMGQGEQERKGYTNIGSLVYTPKPSKDGFATKVLSASLRSSGHFKGQGEEDEPPQWLKQLELLKRLQGEGHHNGDNEKAEQSNERGEEKNTDICALQSNERGEEKYPDSCALQRNERGEEKDPDFCALQSSIEEMGMPTEHEHVQVGQWLQEKRGLVVVEEDADEHEMHQPCKEMANMKMSMKETANMEVLREEIENMEMSRRQYFAAIIVAKEKPGEEALALAAGLRLKLQSILAINSFSSFDS